MGKSHHYVPAFYLRNFSNESKRCITLCDIPSGKLVEKASIKDQACNDYLYGKDGVVEDKLAGLEGSASGVIRRVLERGSPPRRFSEDHFLLCFYAIIQKSRTLRASETTNRFANQFGKAVLRQKLEDPELLAYLDQVDIALTEPMAEALRPSITETPFTFDLKFKLFNNLTSLPLLTSDHPVILHNPLYEDGGPSRLGTANIGLQILLPLSPRCALLFYDEGAYGLGRRESNVVSLHTESQVCAVNAFQWRSARRAVFARPGTDLAWLTSERNKHLQVRVQEDVDVSTSSIEGRAGKGATLIQANTQSVTTGLRLPFIKQERRNPPANNSRDPLVRNHGLASRLYAAAGQFQDGVIGPDAYNMLVKHAYVTAYPNFKLEM